LGVRHVCISLAGKDAIQQEDVKVLYIQEGTAVIVTDGARIAMTSVSSAIASVVLAVVKTSNGG
jgi:hypothetical protein